MGRQLIGSDWRQHTWLACQLRIFLNYGLHPYMDNRTSAAAFYCRRLLGLPYRPARRTEFSEHQWHLVEDPTRYRAIKPGEADKEIPIRKRPTKADQSARDAEQWRRRFAPELRRCPGARGEATE